MKQIVHKGKTIVVTSDDVKDVRKRLIAGNTFDTLTETQRLIACEIARDESLRWNKSNAKRAEQTRLVKQHAPTLKRIEEMDDVKRAKIDAILNG